MDENRGVSYVNVQEPVREMLMGLTKAVRAQSQQIQALDAKLLQQQAAAGRGPSSAELAALVDESVRRATARLEQASSSSSGAGALSEAQAQLARVNEIVQHQSAAITDLNRRLEQTANEVERLQQVPSADHIFTYIDRQIASLATEVERKLAAKAEQSAVESLARTPRREEELSASLRTLTHSVADVKAELERKATREQFQALASQKVDHGAHIELLAAVHEKVSMTQLTSAVNGQVKPLVAAVAALEKAVVIQDASLKTAAAVAGAGASPLLSAGAGAGTGAGAGAGASGRPLDARAVTEIVNDCLRAHPLLDDVLRQQQQQLQLQLQQHTVTPLALDAALSRQHDELLRELAAATDSLADELRRELQGTTARQAQAQAQAQAQTLAQAQAQTQAQAQQLQALASSVGKELKSKASRAELQRLAAFVDESSAESSAIARATEVAVAAAEASRIEFEDSFYDAADHTPRPAGAGSRLATSPRGGGGGSQSRSRLAAWQSPARPASATATATATLAAGAAMSRPSYTPRKSQALEAIAALETVHAEAEGLRKSLLQLKARADKAEAEAAAIKAQQAAAVEAAVAAAKEREREKEKEREKERERERERAAARGTGGHEWRLALGELGSALRRELAERPSRQELEAAGALGGSGIGGVVGSQAVERLEDAVAALRREVARKSDGEELGKAWHELRALQGRVTSELTGGLWLWTSRQLIGESRTVPWDSQVVNAAPSALLWRKGSGMVTVRLPGLYRLSFAVFTTQPVKVTICLNDEPLITTYPESLANSALGTAPEDFSMTAYLNAAMHKEEKYVLRRLRHSAGDVTAVTIDEPLSLPADAVISVRFHSPLAAQALLSLRKL